MSRWEGVSEAYRESFATLCEGTIGRLLADTSGGRLLDVGCGTGDLAGRALREGRDVTAVDAERDMVAMAARTVAGGHVLRAALPDLPFEDGRFDAVTANFVVNHLPDPCAGMRDLGRVTAPGGRVAATIWPAAQPASWASLVGEAFAAAGAVLLSGARLPPELDFARTTEGLAALARDAGLTVVVEDELTWTWHVAVPALWRGITGGVATAGQTYRAQDLDVQARINHEFHLRTGETAHDGVLALPSTAAYVVAQAA